MASGDSPRRTKPRVTSNHISVPTLANSMTTATLDCALDTDTAWLESLRDDTALRTIAEDAGIEFPEDCPPRFSGDLAKSAG